MAIASLSDYIAAIKQIIGITKTAVRTTIAATYFSLFDIAGAPGAGTLAGISTAAGVVPTAAVAGYPAVVAFSPNIGYLSGVKCASSVAGRIYLYDRLFVAGAYAFNAATSLASQPSYAGRVPGAPNYQGLEIWIECVTVFTGNLSIAVTYTNESGVAGRTTGTFATGTALTVGRCMKLPLQAGDSGVQKIESVTATVATVGTFNVMVLRPLWSGRMSIANDLTTADLLKTGMPQVFDSAAFYALYVTDSTSSGVPDIQFEIANK